MDPSNLTIDQLILLRDDSVMSIDSFRKAIQEHKLLINRLEMEIVRREIFGESKKPGSSLGEMVVENARAMWRDSQ